MGEGETYGGRDTGGEKERPREGEGEKEESKQALDLYSQVFLIN